MVGSGTLAGVAACSILPAVALILWAPPAVVTLGTASLQKDGFVVGLLLIGVVALAQLVIRVWLKRPDNWMDKALPLVSMAGICYIIAIITARSRDDLLTVGAYLIGAAILQYPLLWAYFCVFGKRLHDAGQTAWFNLLFLFGFVVASSILNAVLLPVLSPGMMPLMTQIQEIGLKAGFAGMLQAQQEHALQIARGTALTTLASFLITSAGLALVGARLPSDPDANVHGPATGRSDAP